MDTRFSGVRFVWAIFLAAASWLNLYARAGEAAPLVAITPEEVTDPDFAWQGEYLGHSWGRSGVVGIQVVALGNGQFTGRWYDGGLPGAGPITVPGYTLNGKRSEENVIVLSGEGGLRVQLSPDRNVAERTGYGSWQLQRVTRSGPTLAMQPPPGAVVLFDGRSSDQLRNTRLAPDGTLLAGAMTTGAVQDFYLHVEFRTPYMPQARGQGRGNSGIYIQRRYEVQILDSFGLLGTDNECGALYRLQAPSLNMCLPPLTWQTYDIVFRAARWDKSGQKLADAEITVFHNGVAVHYHRPIVRKTGAGQPEAPQPLPIYFQDHGNPVTFRNLWLVHHDQSATGTPPHEGSQPMAFRNRGTSLRAHRWFCR